MLRGETLICHHNGYVRRTRIARGMQWRLQCKHNSAANPSTIRGRLDSPTAVITDKRYSGTSTYEFNSFRNLARMSNCSYLKAIFPI
jgi:hypothetical protein